MRVCFFAGMVACSSMALAVGGDPPRPNATLRFEVEFAPDLLHEGRCSRVLVAVSRDTKGEPRLAIGRYGRNAIPVLGADANGRKVVLDQTAQIAPLKHLAHLPAGEYSVQAVLLQNCDLREVNAPGNLYSRARTVTLDPSKEGTIRLELTESIPTEKIPPGTADVRYLKVHSKLLSAFHKRPMYLRAGLILPRGFAAAKERRYPLRIHIGGYGTRYTAVAAMMEPSAAFHKFWMADETPRMLYLLLDGAGPFGDPYQVNSANNGPYGEAITRELIPYVEKNYRGLGTWQARFLDGVSTGGWASLALQIFYPDFFNGTWSRAPDPVDFRAFELIDIYKDVNAYVNAHGLKRPSSRDLNGDVRTLVCDECQMESVLGHGGRWELSGKDWAAWNATFGPRGDDGLPRPLWDGKSGKIDPSVLEHWKNYDLRLVLAENWRTLGPKLHGKLHVCVGEADEYFLNNAVRRLDDFLSAARPTYGGSMAFGARQGHAWDPDGEKGRMQAMADAFARTTKR